MDCTLATFVHDLSPFLVPPFIGKLGIRWYGFMYVLGFIGAYLLLRWFIKVKACELHEEKAADFVTIIALFGIMLGGRLGYMLIYNRDEFLANPLLFFNFLGGGMASHGAIFMSILVVFVYARWQKLSWLNLGDNLVIGGSLGLFFGRLGNFINGELYGRIAQSGWTMKFPNELRDPNIVSINKLNQLAEKAKDVAPELSVNVRNLIEQSNYFPRHAIVDMMIETARKNKAFEGMMAELLNPRHPSQLYQAFFEGLLVFLILLLIRLKWKNAYHGFISGCFFICYAIARILVENLREPDSKLFFVNTALQMTKGQFYSFLMILVGFGLLTWSLTAKRQNKIITA